jgi:hypothetical protein
MRTIITIAASLAIISSASADGARYYYGADGQSIGSSLPSGPNFRSYYGNDGSYIGNSARAGNTTFYYNNDGSLAGSSMSTGNNASE